MNTPLFPNGITGLSDTKWKGSQGNASKLVGVDFRSTPGIIKAQQKLKKISSTFVGEVETNVVTELCKDIVEVSDGKKLWFSSESAKIWLQDGDTFALAYTLDLDPYDVMTATSSNSVDLSTHLLGGQILFSSDGLKFTGSNAGDKYAYQYSLTNAFDLTTITYNNKFDFTAQLTDTRGLFIGDSGVKMYAASTSVVYQYTLSSAWDATTATYATKNYTISQLTTGEIASIHFNDTGSKMYVLENRSSVAGAVHQYTLSTPWDVTTSTFVQSYTLTGLDNVVQGMSIAPDGTKMYITCYTKKSIQQLSFGTAWDISTLTVDSKNLMLSGLYPAIGISNAVIAGTSTNRKLYFMGTEVVSSNKEEQTITTTQGILYEYKMGAGTEQTKNLGAVLFEDYKINANGTYNVFEKEEYIYWSTEYYIYKIAYSKISSFGSFVQPVGRFLNGDDTYHPMVKQNLEIFIGDKINIAKIDMNYIYINETRFNVKPPERIQTMTGFDIDILVGTKDVNKARVLRWDGISDSWSAQDDVFETGINAFLKDDNYTYVSAGDFGRLYFYNGEKLTLMKRIPGTWDSTHKATINPNATGFLMGIPIFGLSNITGNPTEQGIYGYGGYDTKYTKALSLDFPLSTNEFSGVTIGAIHVNGSDMWMSYKTGTDVGVARIDHTVKYPSAYIETMQLTALKDRNTKTLEEGVCIDYISMPTGTSVTIGAKTKYDTDYTNQAVIVDAEVMSVKTKASIVKINSLQLRFGLVSTANLSPEIENFGKI